MKQAILISVALMVLFTGTANALVTKTFDDVENEVNMRWDNLPLENLTKEQKKERSTLKSVLRWFDKESLTSKKDAKLIKSIVKKLNKFYVEDKKMLGLLATATDAFADEFYANMDEHNRGYGFISETNRRRKAADKANLKVAGLKTMFEEEVDLKELAKLVKKFEGSVAGYGKKVIAALKKEDLTAHQRAFLVDLTEGYLGAESCMTCHEDAGTHMLEAGHWKWQGTTANVPGFEGDELGKNQIINNFCIAVPSNEKRCTQCHPGYGYADNTFDFTNADALDCLVCHDTTGTYAKDKKTAGLPVAGTDLKNVAMNVGAPSRANCGSCHFFAGGGDNVKKGDLGSSLVAPTKAMDVHMGSDGGNFACQKCHETVEHKIPGNQLQDSGRVSCEDCHDTADLSSSYHTGGHLGRMACQTCHIPTFSRQLPTKTWWDWSVAGDADRVPVMDANGKPDYDKMKGEFIWEKDVAPALRWYNGTWSKTFIGRNDVAADLDATFVLGAPLGDSGSGKIYPFKLMKGIQPVDAGNGTILVPHLFPKNAEDTDAYWKGYDWNNALSSGAADAGQTYSGSFTWIETEMYLALNHEVAPRDQARKCATCHGSMGNTGNFPWAELGLSDPLPAPAPK